MSSFHSSESTLPSSGVGAKHLAVKADSGDFRGRFREIISDPINLLIERHPLAGFVYDDLVYLHNGNFVSASGPNAYYQSFSDILIINRGVHEPLEEYVFQEVLKTVGGSPLMVELGAYWGHYSMWLQSKRPRALTYLVEPDCANLAVGMHNFKINCKTGEFINEFVGHNNFIVDRFIQDRTLPKLDILHSDIQGYEMEMLTGCASALVKRIIDYCFISTHSQELHLQVLNYLTSVGYRVEVSADLDHQTTSFDGFLFASNPSIPSVFRNFKPLGREQIYSSDPGQILSAISCVIPASVHQGE